MRVARHFMFTAASSSDLFSQKCSFFLFPTMSCSSVNASQACSVDDGEQEKTLLRRCRDLKPKKLRSKPWVTGQSHLRPALHED